MAAIEKKTNFVIMVDPAKCCGCLICELRCSFRVKKEFNPSKAWIKHRRIGEPDSEYEITFTEQCDSCGICARYCPYGCLTLDERRES